MQDSVILVKDGAISYSNKYANMLLKHLQSEGDDPIDESAVSIKEIDLQIKNINELMSKKTFHLYKTFSFKQKEKDEKENSGESSA